MDKSHIISIWIFIMLSVYLLLFFKNEKDNSTTNLSKEIIRDDYFETYMTFLNNQPPLLIPKTSGKQRIFIFFGTRPEVIKVAPLIQKFRKAKKYFVKTIFTGQHAEIIHPFLELFDINVDIWFNNTLEKGQSLNMLAGKLFLQIDRMPSEPKDIWIVQGDTTSAMVITSVAFRKNVRVAHVEAGLRTFNMYSPFPEEFNRKTISLSATYHFTPTENTRKNLLNEGIDPSRIFVTGNTVIDAAKYMELSNKTVVPNAINGRKPEILILITLHRRENMNRMDILYKAIASVKCAKCLFVVPVHPNPKAGTPAKTICNHDSRFLCCPPLAYQELQWMLGNSAFIMTDSGGIQEEATWYNVPTLVLRKDTERGEAIEAGVAKLVDEVTLKPAMRHILDNLHKQNKTKIFPYGDGNSANRILNIFQTVELPITNGTKLKRSKTDEEFTQSYIHQLKDLFKNKKKPTVAVVLQVIKRNTLQEQLDAVSMQTLVPSTVLVIQYGFYINLKAVIQKFRSEHPKIEIIHFASSKNLRVQGRFHIAYMLEEDYVSFWDDDIAPRSQWLQYCVDYSISNGYGVVGAKGITFDYIDTHDYSVVQSEQHGKNDLVSRTWTFPRVFLRYYLRIEPISRYTGDGAQLAYAFQHYGIYSYKLPQVGKYSTYDLKETSNSKESQPSNQAPRFHLFCILLKHNFKFIKCKNCKDEKILDKCIKYHEAAAKEIEETALGVDIQNNTHAWSR